MTKNAYLWLRMIKRNIVFYPWKSCLPGENFNPRPLDPESAALSTELRAHREFQQHYNKLHEFSKNFCWIWKPDLWFPLLMTELSHNISFKLIAPIQAILSGSQPQSFPCLGQNVSRDNRYYSQNICYGVSAINPVSCGEKRTIHCKASQNQTQHLTFHLGSLSISREAGNRTSWH